MADINFAQITQSAEQGIIHLAQQTLTDYSNQAIADGKTFLQSIEDDLQTYTEQLAKGEIDTDTFKLLMQNDTELAEMVALKKIGLAQADLDKFVNGVISIVITAALSAIPK